MINITCLHCVISITGNNNKQRMAMDFAMASPSGPCQSQAWIEEEGRMRLSSCSLHGGDVMQGRTGLSVGSKVQHQQSHPWDCTNLRLHPTSGGPWQLTRNTELSPRQHSGAGWLYRRSVEADKEEEQRITKSHNKNIIYKHNNNTKISNASIQTDQSTSFNL